MFKFVVAFFLVTNGVPADKPSQIVSYNKTTFPTEEACKGFPETEEGKDAMKYVDAFLASKEGAVSARVGCVKAEDNSI